MEEKIAAIERMIEQMNADLVVLKTDGKNATREELAALSLKLEEIRTRSNEILSSIYDSVDSMKAAQAELTRKLECMEKRSG